MTPLAASLSVRLAFAPFVYPPFVLCRLLPPRASCHAPVTLLPTPYDVRAQILTTAESSWLRRCSS
jgi:hypothetical protein